MKTLVLILLVSLSSCAAHQVSPQRNSQTSGIKTDKKGKISDSDKQMLKKLPKQVVESRKIISDEF